MFSFEFPAYATLALLGGPALFYGGFRDLRHRRLMQNTPTAKIRSMAMGLVEINGVVEPRSMVFAPFSGRPCAYWQVEIATRSGRRHGWTKIHSNSSGNPFHLRDDTGVALVFPKGADCQVSFEVEEARLGIGLPDCYSNYMKENGIWMRHVAKLSTMRFRERVLEAGDRVYVLGSAVPSAQVHTVSELQATGTDDVRAEAFRAKQAEISATVRQGVHEKTFIISQKSERELTLQLGWKATAKLFGGPVLTLSGLGWWLHHLATRG